MESDLTPISTGKPIGEADLVNEHRNLVNYTFAAVYDEDKPILFDAADCRRNLSGRKAYDLVAALAGTFRPDSTVCLHLANDILYPVLVLAILASNSCWTGTNPAYASSELEHHFRTSRTNYVVTATEHLDTVRKAVHASNSGAEIIMFADILDEHLPGPAQDAKTLHSSEQFECNSLAMRSLRDLLHSPSNVNLHTLLDRISVDDTAALMPTSGTTGLPKVAIRTHRSMMLELEALADETANKPYEVRRLFCAPIFHAFSAPEMLFNALRLGHVSYFMRRFDESFAQKVHDFDITETFGAPAMLLRLTAMPGSYHLLKTLRCVAYGGAPLGGELRRRVLGMFKLPPRLIPVYGMTEGGWFTTFKYPEDDGTGSVGRVIPGLEIKIAPMRHLQPVDQQIPGEVLVRGPRIMQGYLGNEEATSAAFEDGWLKTGDIGYLSNGKLYLIDRIKDMIKVNGWQVSPVEIQNVLLQSEDVLESAVYGSGFGVDEHPVACIVRRSARLTAEAVREHLSSRLASYKVRTCEIRFVESIPKSSTGKVVKELLRKMEFPSNA
ncbi:hypothetical protein LTS09_014210 [Friedmanniomyces endolithicus]|nr:hypothetical protein LTS09_014210 [Friedmanniomyces endolithicus]